MSFSLGSVSLLPLAPRHTMLSVDFMNPPNELKLIIGDHLPHKHARFISQDPSVVPLISKTSLPRHLSPAGFFKEYQMKITKRSFLLRQYVSFLCGILLPSILTRIGLSWVTVEGRRTERGYGKW